MKQVFKEPLISVIIPVFNVEPYLSRCLDSIINQTYRNYEVVMVDDGSTDESGRICDKYAIENSFMKVMHKENEGLSEARNNGIEVANGDYITFIDGDDYVEESYIETLVREAISNNSDIVICSHKTISARKVVNPENNSISNYPKEVIIEKMLYSDPIIGVSAWAKLYKRCVISELRYPKGKNYEDTRMTVKYYDRAKTITVVSKSLYNYCLREDSLTSKPYNSGTMDIMEATKEMTSFVLRKYPNMERGVRRKMAWACLSSLAKAIGARDHESCRAIRNELRHIRKNVLLNRKTPKRDKCGIIASMFGNRPYHLIWSLYSMKRNEI